VSLDGIGPWAISIPSERDDAGPPLGASTSGLPSGFTDPRVDHHVPVLTYHVIAPWSTARAYSTVDLDVSPERFEAHLATLRDAGWRTITAEGLAEALETGLRPPPRTFVITIDDGYDDGYRYALPLLQRYGFIATYYVVPGRLDTPTHLSWDQVRGLRAAGMEIGNHTFDHVSLTTQTPGAEAREVDEAQAAITREVGEAPATFAYPFGAVNRSAVSAVQAAGLRLAFTTAWGTTEAWATRYLLPRFHVGASLLPASLLDVIARFG
jgi:peptidoglycan/xylan/chitin deacetylase (PgdA/CDA1 family)